MIKIENVIFCLFHLFYFILLRGYCYPKTMEVSIDYNKLLLEVSIYKRVADDVVTMSEKLIAAMEPSSKKDQFIIKCASIRHRSQVFSKLAEVALRVCADPMVCVELDELRQKVVMEIDAYTKRDINRLFGIHDIVAE